MALSDKTSMAGGDESAKPVVLVVDDEAGTRESLRQILQPRHRLLFADNGRSGLAMVVRESPDVVVADIKMPEMSGTELLGELAASRPDIPVVLITGYATVQTAQAAVRAQAFDYLCKPFEVAEIRAVVERAVVDGRRRRQERRLLGQSGKLQAQVEALIGRLDQKSAVAQLSAELIHELSSPMSVLYGYMSLLEESLAHCNGEQLHADVGEFLEIVKSQVMRCMKLSRNFIDFARDDEVRWELADVNELIRDTLFVLRMRLLREGVESRVRLAANLPRMLVLPTLLQHVFYNLMANAIEAMSRGREGKRGGVLAICSALAVVDGREQLTVIVSDSGCGISAGDHEQIFEPFFTTKPAGQGTGLGLPFCRRVMVQHGGGIDFNSTPGQGSSFWISLPVRRADSERPPAARADDFFGWPAAAPVEPRQPRQPANPRTSLQDLTILRWVEILRTLNAQRPTPNAQRATLNIQVKHDHHQPHG